jgi:hypothetical protein
MIRTIKFKHAKLLSLMQENTKISDEINEIVKEWEKIDQVVKKLSLKMERYKEKIRPLVATEIKKLTKIGEFEVVASTKLDKDQIAVEIIDQIELYKDQLRKKKDVIPEDAKD